MKEDTKFGGRHKIWKKKQNLEEEAKFAGRHKIWRKTQILKEDTKLREKTQNLEEEQSVNRPMNVNRQAFVFSVTKNCLSKSVTKFSDLQTLKIFRKD